jgi:SAM-dependent methyltransferase
MGAQPGTVLLDVGAGLGGPAAFARQEAGVHPLLVELEAQPCTAARRVFGLSTLRADGTALPLADGSVTLAWSLGTLCTTSRQDDLVAELARALAPGATLGLMVLTTTRGATLRSSTGNVFPTAPGLEQMLGRHGFTVTDRRWADSLAQDDAAWEARAERVEVLVRQRHGTDPAYRRADRQERVLGSLLGSGAVRRYLLVMRRTA